MSLIVRKTEVILCKTKHKPYDTELRLKLCKKQSPDVFYKKGVLRNFAKFTGKHLCQRLFFNKVAGVELQVNRTLCQISRNRS